MRDKSREDAMTTNLYKKIVSECYEILSYHGNVLVEDGNTAQITTGPFGLVFFEFGIQGFEERTDKWHLEGWANN